MGRAPCCDKNGLKKGPWTPEEDQKLISYIQLHGPGNWRSLPKNAGLQRCGKSCRLRWTNYLRPDIKRGRFSFEEEETIIQLHSVLGNKWSAIAARLPGRTDNEIKNYWNTHIRKRLLRNGIDPVTHAPRLDLLDLSSLISSALCNPSSLLSLSSLPILNPQLLRLASTLSSLKQDNPDLLLQQLHDNNSNQQQILNALLMQNQGSLLAQTAPNHNHFQNIPAQQSAPNSDTFVVQPNVEESLNLSQPHMVFCNNTSDQYNIPAGESSGFEGVNNGYQNYNIESVISSPVDQLNSSSTFLNSNSTEDDCGERESYCSSLLKFEIPESLDLDDFL